MAKATKRRTNKRAHRGLSSRVLDARPDTLDFRDRTYVPTLVEVPERVPLTQYTKLKLPILDQGAEGACTGFGLAAVANYLLWTRRVVPRRVGVSPRMLYEMARRYDEWPGTDYAGSSARGAMKGWHKHGVCSSKLWTYSATKKDSVLTEARARDAAQRPLGAYFRVNHQDLVALHAAITEVGVLYASAVTHEGWDEVDAKGQIPFEASRHELAGGHAFAIVAYDREGLWIQNSWGSSWGKHGFARIRYDDWLANGTDVWVARLAAPIEFESPRATATSRSAAAGSRESLSQADLRPHLISIGNDGQLRTSGPFGTSAEEARSIFRSDIPRLTRGWKQKRILVYAHGGLVSESSAVQRLADYRAALLEAQVYPLSFVWRSDYWTTVKSILEDALRRRRPEGPLDAAKDYLLDRLDDALEPIARSLGGKRVWDEMKENALRSTTHEEGGARLAAEELALLARDPAVEIHVAAHSAGAIFQAPLVQLLAGQGRLSQGVAKGLNGYGVPIRTCTLWAPACTMELFRACYLPLISGKQIERFSLFTLTDRAEQDDHCAQIYHKSLLYLVSNAFEQRFRVPVIQPHGEAILGMEKFIARDVDLLALFESGRHEWVLAPNTAPVGTPEASQAQHHGDFDDDEPTVKAALARILGSSSAGANVEFAFEPSASSLCDRRREL
ncbi:MAG: C1 family peptidase [Planctomycetota bacterium]